LGRARFQAWLKKSPIETSEDGRIPLVRPREATIQQG
jgi:hypothetical protein